MSCEHYWDWIGDKEMLKYHCNYCPALLINGKIIMPKQAVEEKE